MFWRNIKRIITTTVPRHSMETLLANSNNALHAYIAGFRIKIIPIPPPTLRRFTVKSKINSEVKTYEFKGVKEKRAQTDKQRV